MMSACPACWAVSAITCSSTRRADQRAPGGNQGASGSGWAASRSGSPATSSAVSAAAWEEALEPYFAEHDEIGTGANARGPAMLIIDEQPGRWSVRQIFDDPAGDHDWGISAIVDLAASDEAGTAVIHVTDVGQL